MQSGWPTISGNSSANAFSRDHSCDVTDLFVIEDDDVDVVFHTVVHRLCIHDLQVLSKYIAEGDVGVPNRVRILHWIFGINSVDLGPLQNNVCIQFAGSQCGSGVCCYKVASCVLGSLR